MAVGIVFISFRAGKKVNSKNKCEVGFIEVSSRVRYALELLGLRSVTVANCKVLSREMNHRLGQTLAPITLYRMAYPDRYKVRPYQYSLDLLDEFLELSLRDTPNVVAAAGYEVFKYPNRPEDTALYKLLGLTLGATENRLLEAFFEDLPMEHTALGWERHVIGHSLADYFRANLHEKGSQPLVDRLLQLPQIRTYYFETHVDYNYGLNVYGKAIERVLVTIHGDSIVAFQELLQADDHQRITSCVFGHLMLHYFAWLSKDEVLQRRSERFLKLAELVQYVEGHAMMSPYVTVRFNVAKLLIAYQSGNETRIDVDEWLDLFAFLFHAADHGNRVFGAVILADVLVVLGKRIELQRLMQGLPCDLEKVNSEQPVFIRASLYYALSTESAADQLQQIIDTEYVLGNGEDAYHKLVMDAAVALFGHKSSNSLDRAQLITQTGFLRFENMK
jgi:hypothetical protein